MPNGSEKSIAADILLKEVTQMKKSRKFLQLFLSTFKLSAFTFGGGYVIIPLMRKQFVEKLHWIEEDEMLDLTAIAQSAPGPIAVNASILVGYRTGGILGGIVTALGTVLPPLIILSVISLFYAAFRSNQIINLLLKGMAAGVVAVIFDVVITMAKDLVSQKRLLPILIMCGAFAASVLFNLNVVLIILACGLVGGLQIWYTNRKEKKK